MSSDTIYYVYAYVREDGTPYYIGKGKERRAYQPHRRRNGSDLLPKEESRIIILHNNLSEIEAFDLEKSLISEYGRKDIGTGILQNMTEGGEGNRKTGYTLSDETKRKISEAKQGVKLGPNSVQSPLKGIPRSEETKRKISASNKGRVFGCNVKKSESAKKRTNQAWTGKTRPTKTCPHCGMIGADYLMTRWHFDNCKSIIR